MRTSITTAACTLAVALAWPAPAPAKLYKWVDADGNVSYSERKPPDAAAEEIQVRTAPVTSEEARERLDALNEANEARREARRTEESHATATQERAERLAKNCEIARENLRILKTNARVKDTSGDQPVYLSPEQMQQRLSQAEANIDKYCD